MPEGYFICLESFAGIRILIDGTVLEDGRNAVEDWGLVDKRSISIEKFFVYSSLNPLL